jgi:hypothetical protein
MPSKPNSLFSPSLGERTRAEISNANELVATVGELANTRIRPSCSTTYQRLESPGACNIKIGFEKVKLGKADGADTVPLTARFGATQLPLLGRVSKPNNIEEELDERLLVELLDDVLLDVELLADELLEDEVLADELLD